MTNNLLADNEILQKKLAIAMAALIDIMNWSESLEDEWGDPGERATEALVLINKIGGQ